MNRMIPTDRKRVTVAGSHPHFQFGADRLDARGYCGCAAVNGVEAKGVHIIREAAGTADAGDDDKILLLDA